MRYHLHIPGMPLGDLCELVLESGQQGEPYFDGARKPSKDEWTKQVNLLKAITVVKASVVSCKGNANIRNKNSRTEWRSGTYDPSHCEKPIGSFKRDGQEKSQIGLKRQSSQSGIAAPTPRGSAGS